MIIVTVIILQSTPVSTYPCSSRSTCHGLWATIISLIIDCPSRTRLFFHEWLVSRWTGTDRAARWPAQSRRSWTDDTLTALWRPPRLFPDSGCSYGSFAPWPRISRPAGEQWSFPSVSPTNRTARFHFAGVRMESVIVRHTVPHPRESAKLYVELPAVVPAIVIRLRWQQKAVSSWLVVAMWLCPTVN